MFNKWCCSRFFRFPTCPTIWVLWSYHHGPQTLNTTEPWYPRNRKNIKNIVLKNRRLTCERCPKQPLYVDLGYVSFLNFLQESGVCSPAKAPSKQHCVRGNLIVSPGHVARCRGNASARFKACRSTCTLPRVAGWESKRCKWSTAIPIARKWIEDLGWSNGRILPFRRH